MLTSVQEVKADVVPTASTPEVGNTYYIYNPTTKKFLFAKNANESDKVPYVATLGSPWYLEDAGNEKVYLKLKNENNYLGGQYWGSIGSKDGNAYTLASNDETNYRFTKDGAGWKSAADYTYINVEDALDGYPKQYRVANNSGDLDTTPEEAYYTWQFISEADYATYIRSQIGSGLDVSDLMMDPDIKYVTDKGVMPSGWLQFTYSEGNNGNRTEGTGNTRLEAYSYDGNSNFFFDYYTIVTGLPAGKYEVSASAHDRDDAGGYVYIYNRGTSVKHSCDISRSGDTDYTYTTPTMMFTANGGANIGIAMDENESVKGGNRWITGDNFRLKYYGNNVEFYNPETFTSPNSATAGTWYAYAVTEAGMYKIKSSKAATIYYTQNASDDADNVASKAIAADDGFFNMGLSTGTLYFKTSDAGTITIEKVGNDGADVTSNFITNPSFEENVTGWTCSGATSGPNRENAHAASDGSWYAGFWNSNLSGDINLYQSVTLPAGFYRIEFDAYNDGSNTNKWKEVQLYFGDTKNSELAYNTTYNSWRTFSFEFDVEDETTANLGAKFTPIATGQIWETADNFRLTFLGNTAVNAAKTHLSEEITNANNIYNSGANVGTGVFQITEEAGDDFVAAIATAQAVYDNGSATADDVMDAIDDLKAAEETFLTTLNAPDAEKRYTVILKAGTYDGKAITYLANGRNDMGNYNVQYLKEPNSNYAQAFKFTQVSGITYKMSQIDVDGNERYICTGAKYTGGNTSQIRTTTDASDALVVKIEATNTANIFNIQNTEANDYIGSQDAGVYTINLNKDFTIAEASKAEPNLTIAAGVNWATFMSPFAISLSELNGVEAYNVSGDNDGIIEMSAVEDDIIPANKPVLLYRQTTGENYKPELSGWGTAAANNYTNCYLTGSYSIEYIPVGSYALQKQNSIVAFYKVDTENAIKVGAYRAYLTKSAGSARAVLYFPEDPTAINTLEAVEAEAGALKDGKYLIDGKIVIVKNGVKYGTNGQKLN